MVFLSSFNSALLVMPVWLASELVILILYLMFRKSTNKNNK